MPAHAQSLEDIKSRGKIRIGMLVDFLPYGLLDENNQPAGYEADVANLIAKKLGVKLEIVPVTGVFRIC
ncbi:transporter substrate-binding domain-containing protein [Mesorhizobium sp. M1A.F.Ca.IN.022.07.1.1]|uniref:transporter substrate-binding domain-containing protein n=1 Tax=Mesorhizobium sp. M1A.F.Ca.IN.022.07.1.1 TaxID=2496767 RepID=UPI000FCB7FB0|nr:MULTISPECIES: transporter substrate-binding domain-containing protein [unclassified Mesorhizobium]RUV86879.1 transporter substrate-binding domain-containing protein [Mesorhizobium sp. M1A.F.Ca.IN.022.07.1.1]RWM64889.1 MAG: transporter substrate-binding domain-containing protein [Mesorhizobium sp.]RWM89067.1 MAG: transporter substrate-binding domain-containing protein [Mesorhizobium sp.]TIS70030.1 MAG: transporter substrate-binding domain-containing protein [Mesorhizobium sp.]TJV54505.1 MAG: